MEKEISKKLILYSLFILFSLILYCNSAIGSTLNVPAQYPTIQAGIDAAAEGDTVLVADGVYSGEGNYNIDFSGKAIVLKSQNGPANCIIDPQQQGRGIFFRKNEGPETQLVGFTIRNARAADNTGADSGGGIYCEGASPAISNCIIKNCFSTDDGAGVYFRDSSASLTNCLINDNNADVYGDGGGIGCYAAPISIINCTIEKNRSSGFGGGIYTRSSFITIRNSIIKGNTGYSGGGLYVNANFIMDNCLVANNISNGEWGHGGGLELDGNEAKITNCTFFGNSSTNNGGGIYFNAYSIFYPVVTNSIVWGNTPDEISMREEVTNLIPSVKFSNIKGGYKGEGNFNGDPLFVDPLSGDFHLAVQSPCVDSGTSENSPDTDIEGNLRPQGVGVDVGAYELTGYAETRPQIESFTIAQHPVSFPTELTFRCTATDPDGEIVSYTIDYGDGSPTESNTTGLFTHIYYTSDVYATCSVTDNSGITVNSISLSPLYNGVINVPSDYAAIQDAIDAAADYSNTLILVADGIYKGEGNRNISFKGKAITVKSQNGPKKTIIHCERSGSGFIFNSKEGLDSVLSGFTIKNSASFDNSITNGGIYISYSPTIENCIIMENENGGINIDDGSALIKKCIIKENKTPSFGGGIRISRGRPIISECVISKNMAMGLSPAGTGGGGINISSGVPTIRNSLISKNFTMESGGGIYSSHKDYTVINCTFTENVAGGGVGGAVYNYQTPVPNYTNCIFWNNWPDEIYAVADSYNPLVTYSSIQGGYPGEGNISQDPLFIDPMADNFKLHHDSPCIDKGTADNATRIDIEGTVRPLSLGYDMGAYEMPAYDPMIPVIDSFKADVTQGERPLEVTFTCNAHDIDGDISSYSIDYGDGSDLEVNATGVFSHTYGAVGDSFAICMAHDNDGKTVSSNSILIQPKGPILVPDDFPNIQEAINAASDGDTVIVGDGVYTGNMNKNIFYWGKAITVQSKNGPEHTIIDCEQDGRGVEFSKFEDTDSVLSGFKIVNGNINRGAGIYCIYSSPTIDNCIIHGNTSSSTTGGGGISIHDYSSPIISNSIMSGNSSVRHGGGIFIHSDCYPLIIDSKILNNFTEWAGGGIYNFWYSFTTIINSEISGNIVNDGAGGGIYSGGSYLHIVNSIISENSASSGAGILLRTPQFEGFDDDGNNAIIQNCTIAQNTGSVGAGIYTDLETQASMINSIIWNNYPDEVYNSDERVLSIAYSNIKGGYTGNGNIDYDPLFIDSENGNYELDINSKSIDTGTSYNSPDYDIANFQRPIGFGYDMGAYESIDVPAEPPFLPILNYYGMELGNKWLYEGTRQGETITMEREISVVDQSTFQVSTYIIETKENGSFVKKEWYQNGGNQLYLWGTTIEVNGTYYNIQFSKGLRALWFYNTLLYNNSNSSAVTEIFGNEFNVSLKVAYWEKTTIDFSGDTVEAFKVYYELHIWGTTAELTIDITEAYYRWFVPYLGFVREQSMDGDTVESTSFTLDGGNFIFPDGDTDGDELTDYNEFFIYNTTWCFADIDSDGCNDNCEILAGTEPYNYDTDNDGMPDGWEVQYDFDPLLDDADEDADGDGFSNIKEYQRETDPTDYNSHPSKGMPWLPLLLGDD